MCIHQNGTNEHLTFVICMSDVRHRFVKRGQMLKRSARDDLPALTTVNLWKIRNATPEAGSDA